MERKTGQKIRQLFKDEQFYKGVITIIVMGILSFLLMSMTFMFSNASYDSPLFESYFRGRWLMLMNFIPIFLTMVFFALLFNRLWPSSPYLVECFLLCL